MKSVAFHNLGCKVNTYEMEVMQQILQNNDYEIVEFTQKADVYVVNTCTVTNIADRKSRQMLHRAKQLNPSAVVVAAGCYAQTGLEELKKDLSVDIIIGNNHKTEIATILEEYYSKRKSVKLTDENNALFSADIECEESKSSPDNIKMEVVSDLNRVDFENSMLYDRAERTRVDIKIQDGCNQFCSYCAIPLSRGRVRSKKPEDVLNEIASLVANGHKEVVLTGIHISSYGIDFDDSAWEMGEIKPSSHESEKTGERMRDYRGESKLMALIEMIGDMEPAKKPSRIRLGSFEPRILTPDVCDRLAQIDEICPHFHISLQSGCDETLKRMNRHYTALEYKEAVDNIRKAYAKKGRRVAITTDVIVGFPGETEKEFEVTYNYLNELQLYEMHIFKYSRRKGTVADTMKDQVPESVKDSRSDALLQMTSRLSDEYRNKALGQSAEVLFEEEKGKYLIGHTDDYIKVALSLDDAKRYGCASGDVVTVRLVSAFEKEMLLAEII